MNRVQLDGVRVAARSFILLGMLIAACQSSDQVDRQTAVPPTAPAVAAAPTPLYPATIGQADPLAARLCDTVQSVPLRRKAECCGTAPSTGLHGECVRVLTATLGDGAVRIEPSAVDRCTEAVSRQLQGCDWVTPLMPALPAACLGIIQGQVNTGQRCRSTLECAEGLVCRGVRPSTAGVCGAPSPIGGACAAAVDTLVTYTRQPSDDPHHPTCAGYCLQGQCSAPVGLGETCMSNPQCVVGTHCAAGRCVDGPPPKIGEPCDKTICEGAAACVEGTCTALKPSGEPCTLPFECQGSCLKAPGATLGTCSMQCGWVPPAASAPPAQRKPGTADGTTQRGRRPQPSGGRGAGGRGRIVTPSAE